MAVMSMFGSRTLPGMKYLDGIRCKRCDKLKIPRCDCHRNLEDKS